MQNDYSTIGDVNISLCMNIYFVILLKQFRKGDLATHFASF